MVTEGYHAQIAIHGILKYCFRDMLGDDQRHTLFYFLDIMRAVLEESIAEDCLPELKERMYTAFALLERDFPVALQVLTFCLGIGSRRGKLLE